MRRKACDLVKPGTSKNRQNLLCRKFGKRNVIGSAFLFSFLIWDYLEDQPV
ncbi:hypothetical protein GGP69_002792 [Salinibacter ruber]|nr:hypothetical protein [Salinibacter ruber]